MSETNQDLEVKEFVRTVRAMRDAQRLYFKTRKQDDLVASKRLETAVDMRVSQLAERVGL